MAKETKDLETTEKKKTKKTVSSSKKATKKNVSSSKKAVAKKAATTAEKATSSKKTAATKKTPAAKKVAEPEKKTTAKKTTTTKKTATSKKAATAKKTTTEKKTATSKKTTTTKKAADSKKAATTKKETVKKTEPTVSKKTSKKKVVSTKSKKSVSEFKAEYYDLPYMYNRTIVKVLAQTPKMLFIYWEISEEDRELFKRTYGEYFFNHTKPILIVYNDTMHYSFEVEVDDFANSWYLHINDADCEYHVELGRRPIPNIDHQFQPIYIPYYVYVTSSNEMTSPNNSIKFDSNLKSFKFRNVKTGEIIEKDIAQFSFITNVGIFNIKDLYKFLFPNENFEFENIVLGNTSSGALSTSGVFSSQFK